VICKDKKYIYQPKNSKPSKNPSPDILILETKNFVQKSVALANARHLRSERSFFCIYLTLARSFPPLSPLKAQNGDAHAIYLEASLSITPFQSLLFRTNGEIEVKAHNSKRAQREALQIERSSPRIMIQCVYCGIPLCRIFCAATGTRFSSIIFSLPVPLSHRR
jgi:hypothetical protein